MLLNAYILKDYIKCKNCIQYIRSDRLTCRLKSPALYDPQRRLRPERAYILSAEAFLAAPSFPKDAVLLVSTEQPTEDLLDSVKHRAEELSCDILLLAEPVGTAQVLNRTLEVFDYFNDWTIRLNQCFLREDVLQALGDCSLEVLHNPTGLYSASFRILRFYEKPRPGFEPTYYSWEQGTFMPQSDVNELLLQPDFVRSWELDGPQYWPPDARSNCCLYQNIGIEHRYVARVVITDRHTPFLESDHAVLQYFCSFLEQALSRVGTPSLNNHPTQLDDLILKLAHSRLLVSPEVFGNMLEAMHWQEKDRWFCCKVLSPTDVAVGSLNNACVRLEDSVRGSCAVKDRDDILLLVNLRLAGKTRDKVVSEIVYLLREYLLRAGFSREFSDLRALQSYYLQTDIALRLGQKNNPMQWSFRFEDYAFEYITEQSTAGMDPRALAHPGLLRLMEYDRENGRNYAPTLRAYLENDRNVAATIRMLYMQRATFLYQLQRIREITESDFDLCSTRLYYLMSYQMLDLLQSGEKT